MSTIPSHRPPAPEPQRRRGLLLAASGVLILSVDSLLVRLAAVDGWTVLFWRGGLMALTLGGAALVFERRLTLAQLARPVSWLLGLSFALSTAAFVLSILLTRVANTVVIISAGPLFAALFSARYLHERVPFRTWLAIAGTLTGVVIVCSAGLGAGSLAGDLLALGNALFMGASMTLLRGNPQTGRALILALSGVLLALACAPLANLQPAGTSLAVLLLMGLAQMPLSLLLLTSATRYLPAPEVSLFLLLETALAPLWVWLVLGETVPTATLAGGLLIVATLLLHSLASLRRERGSV